MWDRRRGASNVLVIEKKIDIVIKFVVRRESEDEKLKWLETETPIYHFYFYI